MSFLSLLHVLIYPTVLMQRGKVRVKRKLVTANSLTLKSLCIIQKAPDWVRILYCDRKEIHRGLQSNGGGRKVNRKWLLSLLITPN